MSQKASSELTFHDTSTYFSEDEWQVLQEWQKDLYRNVMEEIHLALISLGPLIASTIGQLRTKEVDEVCKVDNQFCMSRQRSSHTSGDTVTKPDVLLKQNTKGLQHLSSQDLQGKRENTSTEDFLFLNAESSLSKEEPISILIDHLGAEIRGQYTDPNSGYDEATFCIKEESETSCFDYDASNSIENISEAIGDAVINCGSKIGYHEKSPKKQSWHQLESAKHNLTFVHTHGNETYSKSKKWSVTMADSHGNQSVVHAKGSLSKPPLALFQESSENQKLEEYDRTNNQININSFMCQTKIQNNLRRYSCTECEKHFSKKGYLVRHQGLHSGLRPYQCKECDRSFSRKEYLIVHSRTHTGVRPYNCPMCGKSFTQKGALNVHQSTHTNFKPYQCTQCKKRFRQKGYLAKHQKTHIQHR